MKNLPNEKVKLYYLQLCNLLDELCVKQNVAKETLIDTMVRTDVNNILAVDFYSKHAKGHEFHQYYVIKYIGLKLQWQLLKNDGAQIDFDKDNLPHELDNDNKFKGFLEPEDWSIAHSSGIETMNSSLFTLALDSLRDLHLESELVSESPLPGTTSSLSPMQGQLASGSSLASRTLQNSILRIGVALRM